MRSVKRAMIVGALSIVVGQTLGISPARAQGFNARDSLGGYGGSMSNLNSSMSMGGPVIPYAGTFGGFMPARMGETGGLRFEPRAGFLPGTRRTSFNMSTMSGGMSTMSGGIGQGFGSSARSLSNISSQATMGLSGRGMPMSGVGDRGVAPPSFGYPFRQPPNLISPSSPGMGMSM